MLYVHCLSCSLLQKPVFRGFQFLKIIDKEKNQCIKDKNGSTEHSKGNKTVPGKVATARTEDGHK